MGLAAALLVGCQQNGEAGEKDSARAVWGYLRAAVQRERLGSARARDQICGLLTLELRDKLATRYDRGARPSGCGFIAQVPALDGKAALGELTGLRVLPGRTVHARYRLGNGTAARVESVEFTEVNPHRWQITGLMGLRGTHN